MHILWVGVLRPIMYTQGHTVKHTLRVGVLRPARYTQGYTVIHALRVGVLRPASYGLKVLQKSFQDWMYI